MVYRDPLNVIFNFQVDKVYARKQYNKFIRLFITYNTYGLDNQEPWEPLIKQDAHRGLIDNFNYCEFQQLSFSKIECILCIVEELIIKTTDKYLDFNQGLKQLYKKLLEQYIYFFEKRRIEIQLKISGCSQQKTLILLKSTKNKTTEKINKLLILQKTKTGLE